MIRHYINFAFRALKKNFGYTLIHLFGLACGFAVTILIFLYVQNELSYDKFNTKIDKIARLIAYRDNGDGSQSPGQSMPLPLGPAFMEDIASARDFVRISGADGVHVIGGDVQDLEYVTFADPALFSMFDFPLVRGNAGTLFHSPTEVVLTEQLAIKYFGTTDIVGKTLAMFLEGERRSFTVVAVAKDVPANSTIQFKMVIPMAATFRYEEGSKKWNWWRVKTYVEFDRPVKEIDTAIVSGVIDRHRGDHTGKDSVPLKLQPLAKVHLDPETGGSNPLYSYILGGIALIILLIAGINYVSLGIARGAVRAREVAVRKLFGAVRSQVIYQFLAESTLLATSAVVIGIALAELALPAFQFYVGRTLSFSLVSNFYLIAFGLLVALVVGFCAGIVPAIMLSRPQPAEIFRRAGRLAKSGLLMRSMTVVQFGLSIFLIIATIIMHQQNTFLKEKPLGYSPDLVMVIQRSPDKNINDLDFLQRFRSELAGNPHVINVSATSASFNRGYDSYGWEGTDKHYTSFVYRVDPQYISTLKMNLIAGRDFKSDPTADLTNPIIVNESFLKQMGSSCSVGSTVPGLDTMFDQFGTPTIVGVVQDYNFLSLQNEIGPALLFTRELYPYFQLLVRIDNKDLPSATAAVEQAYEKVSSGLKCSWVFMENDLADQYSDERRWSKIISGSALFAISIAALGIFGLSGITTVRRSKEVGVRKVLGASVFQILRLINREFLIIVVIANIIVWPLAWYFANRWLQNFAYHITLSIWSFAIGAVIAVAVAMLAASAHTLRAALQNPSHVLRCE